MLSSIKCHCKKQASYFVPLTDVIVAEGVCTVMSAAHLEWIAACHVADVDDEVEEVEREPAEAVQHRDRHQHDVGAPRTGTVGGLDFDWQSL